MGIRTALVDLIVKTQSQGDNSQKAASTAYVDAGLSPKAPLASPALTGNPTAPTQSPLDGSTKIATTEYVDDAVAAGGGGGGGQTFAFLATTADHDGANDTNTRSWFNGETHTGFNLTSGRMYAFEGCLILFRPAGSSGSSPRLGFGGAGIIDSGRFSSEAVQIANNTDSNESGSGNVTAFGGGPTPGNGGDFVVTGSISVGTGPTKWIIAIKGYIRCTGSGAWFPRFSFSANPGATPVVKIGTYCKLYDIGANSSDIGATV